MSHFVDKCLAKVERAESLYQELVNAAEAFQSGVKGELSEEKFQDIYLTVLRIPPPPVLISLLFGDVIHNLRSALDHAVCGLGRATGCTEPMKLEFPYGDSERKLNKRIEEISRKHCLPNSTSSFLQSLNCHAEKGGNAILSQLHYLDIHDKHREIIRATCSAFLTQARFTHPCIISSAVESSGKQYRSTFNGGIQDIEITERGVVIEIHSIEGAPYVSEVNVNLALKVIDSNRNINSPIKKIIEPTIEEVRRVLSLFKEIHPDLIEAEPSASPPYDNYWQLKRLIHPVITVAKPLIAESPPSAQGLIGGVENDVNDI